MAIDSEKLKQEREEAWRISIRSKMKNKERTDLPRVKMHEVDASERVKSNIEVNTGLTEKEAVAEAHRCLDCPNPTCITGCPVEINIPKFIKHVENGAFADAIKAIKETSSLPAVCVRVCPQEKQCEAQCFYTQKLKKEPVAIGYLERFVADYEREKGEISVPETAAPNGIKIACIGSGPAGLTFAGDMAKKGYDVTVFEALHEIGGVIIS